MGGALSFIGDAGHVAAAGLFAVLAIALGRRLADATQGRLLVAALSLTAIWSLATAFDGVRQLESGVMESLRNCGWLACLFAFGGARRTRASGASAVYAVLVIVLVGQSLVDMLWAVNGPDDTHPGTVVEAGLMLRMLWALGALILVQRIFVSIGGRARARVAPVMAAMAAMWTYDLLLYATAFSQADGTPLLYALRGLVMAGLAPAIALVIRTQADQQLHPSRALALRGVAVAGLLGLLFLMLLAMASLDRVGSPFLRVMLTGSIFAVIVTALLVLPTMRFRAFVKVMIAKHLFRHRYDYRAAWMGFADTIGQGAAGDEAFHGRAIKAVADITDSPAGLLLLAQEDGSDLAVHGQWQWPGELDESLRIPGALAEKLRARFWIVDIDVARRGEGDNAAERGEGEAELPAWLLADRTAWALVPIIHFERLIGALLLARPRIDRPLDWEDLDMLRTAGRQLASHIAQAQGQQALAEARRFDEFNRRFAFIIHDIKNLVSQLALVARNAQRHADNPEFRADMVLTLQDCVGRMNDLLARLSQHNSAPALEPVALPLADVARAVAARRGGGHPLLVDGDLGVIGWADAGRVEQIVSHLVQNAIDASAPGVPVLLHMEQADGMACLSVIDKGCGMSGAFVRDELFRPFASSKPGGFGIGAYEARELTRAMGGRLLVESVSGKGSRFTLMLPLARVVARDESGQEEAA